MPGEIEQGRVIDVVTRVESDSDMRARVEAAMAPSKPFVANQALAPVPSRFRLVPTNYIEAVEMAKMIHRSKMCPKAYRAEEGGSWEDVLIAGEFGFSLGLQWIQALQNVAVINGRPSIWGDAVAAIILAQPDLERFYWPTPKGDEPGLCIIKRRGFPDEFKAEFTVEDVKRAGLDKKAGPHQTYPQRMRAFRALGFCGRAAYADKLTGLILAEEAMDLPPAIDVVPQTDGSFAVDLLAGVEPKSADRITKAMAMLQLSPAQQRVVVNQHLRADGDQRPMPERVAALLKYLEQDYRERAAALKPAPPANAKEPSPEPSAAATPATDGPAPATSTSQSDPQPAAPAMPSSSESKPIFDGSF